MKIIINLFIFFFVCFSKCLAAEKLTLILDWFPNPNHAPLFIAKDKGFFQQQNLDVEIIGPANPSDPPKFAAAKKADIVITYQPQFIEQVDRGLPLIRIGTLVDQPLDCLVVLASSPIKKISDLKNKRVGYSPGSINSVALKTMLGKQHLSLNDIEHINVQFDLTQALLAKKIDAATGMMRNFELIQMQLAGQAGRAFFPEEMGVPPYSELILVTHVSNVKNEKIVRFLNALENATHYLKSNPEESWKIFAKNHPALNDHLNQMIWFSSIKYFSDRPSHFDVHQWKTFIEFMYNNQLISSIQPIEHYAINLKKE